MSPNQWSASVPFDPESDSTPVELDAFWTRSSDTEGGAFAVVVGAKAWEMGWAPRAMVTLATIWADRGRRVLLADLALGSPSLHEQLGELNSEGIADIFQFGASVGSVARTIPGRGFRLIPAGPYIPDPVAILRSTNWEQIIGQLVDDRSILLSYLPADLEGATDFVRLVGRIIILAEPTELAELSQRYSAFGTVELVLVPPMVALGEEVEHTPAPKGPRVLFDDPVLTEPPLLPRRGRPARKKASPILIGLLLLVIAGGGWLTLREQGMLPDWLDLPADSKLGGLIGSGSRSGDETIGEPPEVSPREGADSENAAMLPAPIETPLPYSVAVEAHQDYTTAMERVEILERSEPGIRFFLSPIPNQGLVYYRLLAGPVADTAEAWSLMRQLVAARQKTDLDPWSIRPTVWAYHLGDFESEPEAMQRATALLEQQIPSYMVEVEYTNGPSHYRLYAGAYEGPGPAEVMADLLREAGIEAPLVRRQGKSIR